MIIVTGASGGLGVLLLENLSDVDSVVDTYNTHCPELPAGSPIRMYQVDVADQDSVRRFVGAIAPEANRITLSISQACRAADWLWTWMPRNGTGSSTSVSRGRF